MFGFLFGRLFTGEIKMQDRRHLLAEYAARKSESAFRELVEAYLGLVHGTAARLTGGDSHLAEDVCQMVFLHLARRAESLSPDVMLGGWLHRHTCFVARTMMRGERRRLQRERLAMELNEPEQTSRAAALLDGLIEKLGAKDRDAILLRFFEQKDFQAVGAAIGVSEDAARMRVGRALEKLRRLLEQKGSVLTTGALAGLLSSATAQAAPMGLAAAIAASAAGAAATGGAATSVLAFMTTKLKIGLAGAVALGMVSTQYLALRETEGENARLLAKLTLATEKNENLARDLAAASAARSSDEENQVELARLRNEVSQLRVREKELAAQVEFAQRATTPPEKTPREGEVIPREAWAFRGYATPEQALESVLWAMSQGNLESVLRGVTEVTRQEMLKDHVGKTALEIEKSLKDDASDAQALRFDRRRAAQNGGVTFIIASREQDNGETRMRDETVLTFVQEGNEWKLHLAPD